MSNKLDVIKSDNKAIIDLKNEVSTVVSPKNQREEQLLINNILYMNEEVKNNKSLALAIQKDCNKYAIYLKNLTTLGLDLSQKQAYFLPFGNEITSVLDYKTLMALIKKHTDVISIEAALVYQNEEFEVEQNKVVKHKQNPFASKQERGDLIGAYSVFTLENGMKDYYFASLEEIEKVKSCSKSANSKFSPWSGWYEEMVKKTIIRKGMKFYPLIMDFDEQQALDQVDNDVDFSQPQKTYNNVITVENTSDTPNTDNIDVKKAQERTKKSGELINKVRELGLDLHDFMKKNNLNKETPIEKIEELIANLDKQIEEKNNSGWDDILSDVEAMDADVIEEVEK